MRTVPYFLAFSVRVKFPPNQNRALQLAQLLPADEVLQRDFVRIGRSHHVEDFVLHVLK